MAALLARVARGIRALAGKRDVGVFRRGDIVWELDPKEGIDFAIYLQGVRARDLAGYRTVVQPEFVVLDIGADIGSHTLPLAQMKGPSGRVYSFEPTDYLFGKQGRNLSLNPDFSKRVNALQAMPVGRPTQERPEAIPSSWPLDIAVSGCSLGQKQGTVRPCRLPRMFRHDRSI
jgi:hypothetical protein